MITEKELVDAMARAVAQEEGFFHKASVPARLNNPGCLTHWCDRSRTPYPVVNGYVQFPDLPTGWAALREQVRINVVKRRLSWLEFFAGSRRMPYRGFRYEHPDPQAYARAVMTRVCAPLGVSPWLGAPVVALAEGKANG